MAGSADNDRNRGGGLVSSLGDVPIKDKLIIALLMVILGGGGAFGYRTLDPPRKDPFTGTEGKRLEERIEVCERMNALDEEHRVIAREGYARMRSLEKEQAAHARAIQVIERDHAAIMTWIRGER